MSVVSIIKRVTVPNIRNRKGKDPIVCLTSYNACMSSLADKHCDIILVGDSLSMVEYGYDTTIPATLDMMIAHGEIVVRSTERSLIVVDMPFGTYEESPQQAYRNACRILKETGCTAIKLEGGALYAETISFLTQRGIPVMAHVGLLPQYINYLGCYKIQGRTTEAQDLLLKDALAVQEAGAFAVVLEATIENVATFITSKLSIPTIGIGASADCDGQILVLEDMLGLTERTPKFVRKYADLSRIIDSAIENYAKDVKDRSFPGKDEIYE